MKARRSVYNLVFGFGSQIITIAFGIIIPRLFLVNLGSEMNGLMSSINQLFVYLFLLEAGVGTASIQALYNPVSKDDKSSINSILSATSRYYNKTGIYYFFTVLLFAIIYPFIIKTNLDKLSIIIIILLSGMGGVINYFFQGKYKLLLTAEGKEYINTSVNTIINVTTSIVKIILLVLGFNIIVIQATYLILTVFKMIIYKVYISKHYKWVNLNVEPNFKAISQNKSVMIHQLAGLIFTNTDIFILTIFCGLKVASVYAMYNLLFNMIDMAIFTVDGSVSFVLGQSYHQDKTKYLKFYDSYEVYFMAFVFSVLTVAYIMILPFMKLYTSGVTDINYINYLLPIFFVGIKILGCARTPANNAITVAGHFKDTQNRAIIESIINIVCSLIFVNLFGIYGVLMGTLVALLYRSTDMVIYANRKILHRSPWVTGKRWLIDVILFIIIVFISSIIKNNPLSYVEIAMETMVLSIIIFPIYFIIISLFEKDSYNFTMERFKMYLYKFRR